MKTAKQKTNDEVINDLMIYGNPMKQLVILEAVYKYTEQVTSIPRGEYRARLPEDSFIHPDSWYDCCKEIKEVLDKHLSPEKRREPPKIADLKDCTCGECTEEYRYCRSESECEECGEMIPDVVPGMVNRFHKRSCSLYPTS